MNLGKTILYGRYLLHPIKRDENGKPMSFLKPVKLKLMKY